MLSAKRQSLRTCIELQPQMNHGDMDMVIQRANALKLLQKASKPAGGGNTNTRENRALRTADDVFQTFQDLGFSLTRSPDADGEGKGAYFGFTKDHHSGTDTVWDAEFYLQWNMLPLFLGKTNTEPVLDMGVLRLDRFGTSVQGKITSTDNTTTDAWRFRLESEGYLRLKQSDNTSLPIADISISLKDESDRDFHVNRLGAEAWATPLIESIYIGSYSGTTKDWVNFRWRPYVGFDAGETTTDSAQASQRDANLWLMAKGKVELSFGLLSDHLGFKNIIISAEDRIVYLTERDTAQLSKGQPKYRFHQQYWLRT